MLRDKNLLRDYSQKYLEILKGEFAGLNLTRILDDEEFYHKQILDSVIPYEQISEVQELFDSAELVVDIGFGGGFPILPLAELMKFKFFLGFEARGKKAKAVNRIAEILEQNNVMCFHERVENILFDMDDTVVTFKAVGRVDDFLRRITPATSDLNIVFFKGPSYEKDEEKDAIKLKYWKQVKKINYEIDGTEQRKIVIFQPKSVPRGTKKSLVRLTSFLSNI